VILNLSSASGLILLGLVDETAAILLQEVRAARGLDKEECIRLIHHMGIIKHRLECNLDFDYPFRGPVEWGFPLHGKMPK